MVGDEILAVLLGGLPMHRPRETDDLLEELQKAAEEHRKILDRQAELIARLREELKDVRPGEH